MLEVELAYCSSFFTKDCPFLVEGILLNLGGSRPLKSRLSSYSALFPHVSFISGIIMEVKGELLQIFAA
jgi:hypothetical protein